MEEREEDLVSPIFTHMHDCEGPGRTTREGGSEWEPFKKILLDENKAYGPIQLNTSLSSNRQSDTSQLVTCSP